MAIFVTPPRVHKYFKKHQSIKTSLLIPDVGPDIQPLIDNNYINPLVFLRYSNIFVYLLTETDYQKMRDIGAIQIEPQPLLPTLSSNFG